jgi:hypothetical protein
MPVIFRNVKIFVVVNGLHQYTIQIPWRVPHLRIRKYSNMSENQAASYEKSLIHEIVQVTTTHYTICIAWKLRGNDNSIQKYLQWHQRGSDNTLQKFVFNVVLTQKSLPGLSSLLSWHIYIPPWFVFNVVLTHRYPSLIWLQCCLDT